MKAYRVGLVGLKFGRFLLNTLATMPRAKVIAVSDRRSEELESLGERYGVNPYRDALEMLRRESLDILVLAISPRARADILGAARERSVALFVEKPWASDAASADAFAAICKGYEAKVMSGFSFRYLPAFAKLRSLVPAALGEARLLQAQYLWHIGGPSDTWLWDPRNGGGFFNENSCHLFDAVNAVLGKPVSLTARGDSFCDRPSEDGAVATVSYENGSVASLAIGGIASPAFMDYPRMELWAAKGQARLSGRMHIWTDLTWACSGQEAPSVLSTQPEFVDRTRYTAAFEHFFACLDKGLRPDTSVEEGRVAVKMAEAVYRSIRSEQAVAL